MKPASLSASATDKFQSCPADFHASYIIRAHDLSGVAADLGTTCHSALEELVKRGLHFPQQPLTVLIEIFDRHYDLMFPGDDSKREDGRKMMRNWYERSGDDYWQGRTVLTTEVKKSFPVKLPDGTEIPFNYIFDRQDSLRDGARIDVIDYKSVALPVQPEELKRRVQPRAYSLATRIANPQVEEIRVYYDLLRYEMVGTTFTREDDIATWEWLKDLVQRIWDADGTEEIINPNCRWCIRKIACKEFLKHDEVGGMLSISDPAQAADARAILEWKRAAIVNAISSLDEVLFQYAETNEVLEFTTEKTKVNVGISGRREVDSERVAAIVGPELMAKYGNVGVTAVDAMIKAGEVTEEQASQLKQVTRKKMTAPKIKTVPLTPFDED